jgi:hypothetical protein
MPSTTKLASHRLPFLFLSTFDPHFNTMFCYTTEIKEERSPLHSADKRYQCHYARPQHRAPSTHFFSTLPFPTNPFFSPSNDKSTSTSSQSISSCTHPLQPSGLPLRPTHPRPFTSLTNQASHRITNSAPSVNSQRLPTHLAPFAAPQQIEFLRRAVFSRCTPAGPQDSNLTALLGFVPRVGSIYVWVWHGTSLERVSCVEPVVRARWKWRTRLELQCHACVGSLSRA